MERETKPAADERQATVKNLTQEQEKEKELDVQRVLDSLPSSERQVIALAIKRSSFKGPLPPPEVLKGYEAILPGASERILKMVEKQQDHRIAVEQAIVKERIKQSGYGQIWGGFLVTLFGIIALILGYCEHDWLAGVLGTSTIIGLATIFVLNKIPKPGKKEDVDAGDE